MTPFFDRFYFGTFLILPVAAAITSLSGGTWKDITADAGLDDLPGSQLKFADLTGDLLPELILMPAGKGARPPRVFLQETGGVDHAPRVPTYHELKNHGLPAMTTADILVFADINNDGINDAILGRYLDIYQEDYAPPQSGPGRNSWLPGRGDGTFGAPKPILEATLGTTRSAAVGDVNMDGLPDILFGNWYERYFSGYEGFPNDLLLQYQDQHENVHFARWPLPDETRPTDFRLDLGGRPTYGVVMPRLDGGLPMLLELNYGRRWNRLYQMEHRKPLREPRDEDTPPLVPKDPRAWSQHRIHQLRGRNIAPEANVDGDSIRHGRHPQWPLAHANARPRSQRPDEPPFRANGNTFDAAVGDIDNDGDFDLFLTTIIHAWAGESSDRSRFLVNQLKETGKLKFFSFSRLSVDRIPEMPPPGEPLEEVHTRYNQGDIYAELADLNHDGRLDLILCSSDYPDPPPHEEKLRIYFQQPDGRFKDVTADTGIQHVGAGMPLLADINNDGALDLMVGQSFNRLTREQRHKAARISGAIGEDSPPDARPETRTRLFLNNSTKGRKSIILHLDGNPAMGINRNALGAIVRMTADLDNDPGTEPVTQVRQLLGPGGHAGKQSQFLIHFGLNKAGAAQKITIHWPDREGTTSTFENVPAGKYRVAPGSNTLNPVR